jgi:hypothetical protein
MPECLRWYLLGVNTGFLMLMAPVAMTVLIMGYLQRKGKRD